MAHPMLVRAAQLVEQARVLNDEFPDKVKMPAEIAGRIDKLLDAAKAARDHATREAGITDLDNWLHQPEYKHDMRAGMGGDGVNYDTTFTPDGLEGSNVATPARWAAAAAKALSTAAGGAKAVVSGSLTVPALLVDAVANPQQARRLLQLIPTRTISENNYAFLRQTVRTTNAAPVADEATKPTSVYTFTEVEDRARVVAHLSEPIPQRFLTDHDEVERLLRGEMAHGLLTAIEGQAVTGNGTGENFTGILNTAGTTAVPFATDLVTTLRKARTALADLEEEPTAWVVGTGDAEALDLTREDGATGNFLALARILGDLPFVITTALSAGTALLGDWQQTRLYVREGARLDTDTAGEELFDKNRVKLRAEQRCNVAVLRPQAIAVISTTA